VSTVLSAIMTLVVPTARPVVIARWVFAGVRALFRMRGSLARSFEARDRELVPVRTLSLFALATIWLVLTGSRYMLLYWSLGRGADLDRLRRLAGHYDRCCCRWPHPAAQPVPGLIRRLWTVCRAGRRSTLPCNGRRRGWAWMH
jgi:hypothetical protein